MPLLLIFGRGVADSAMVLTTCWFLFISFRDHSWGWVKIRWFQVAFVVWIYLILASLMVDFDKARAIKAALVWIRFPLFVAAFITLISPQAFTQRYFTRFLIALLGFVAIDTIIQFIFGISLSGHPKPDYMGRLTGPFNRLVVGVYLERLAWPVIGFVFGWALADGKSLKRLGLAILFSLLMGIAILLSGERMAFMLFGLCGLVFAIGAKKLRLPLFVCGAVALALTVGLVAFQPTLKERFITRTVPYLTNLSNSPYGSVWHNGLAAWKHSPILGIGRNNFVPACEALGRSGGFINEHEERGGKLICVRHPHNIYIEWLAEGGIIGLGLFLVMIGLIIRQAILNLIKENHDIKEYYTRLGLAVGLIPFLWPFMSSMSFFTNWSAVLFWWVVGLVLQPSPETMIAEKNGAECRT